MGDELKWLLKHGGRGEIFESCDILENVPTSHVLSLALFMNACSDSASCHSLAYAITSTGVCLWLSAPPLAQCCFFGASCLT